jgi:hypothetical protein
VPLLFHNAIFQDSKCRLASLNRHVLIGLLLAAGGRSILRLDHLVSRVGMRSVEDASRDLLELALSVDHHDVPASVVAHY